MVVKTSGTREPYDREKLRAGIATACAKTSVSAAQIEELLDELELELLSAARREISSKQLGELILERLRPVNEVAYVRFASVYRQFQSIDDFIGELEQLKDPGNAVASKVN